MTFDPPWIDGPPDVPTPRHQTSLADRIALLGIGSCSCLTKSPDVHMHDGACRYREIMEIADSVDELDAERGRLSLERDQARELVAEANNSLYGSQNYFHSMTGGPFDKHHLARGIEDLKASVRDSYAANAERGRLREALEGLVKFVEGAGEYEAEIGLKNFEAYTSARSALPASDEK